MTATMKKPCHESFLSLYLIIFQSPYISIVVVFVVIVVFFLFFLGGGRGGGGCVVGSTWQQQCRICLLLGHQNSAMKWGKCIK